VSALRDGVFLHSCDNNGSCPAWPAHPSREAAARIAVIIGVDRFITGGIMRRLLYQVVLSCMFLPWWISPAKAGGVLPPGDHCPLPLIPPETAVTCYLPLHVAVAEQRLAGVISPVLTVRHVMRLTFLEVETQTTVGPVLGLIPSSSPPSTLLYVFVAGSRLDHFATACPPPPHRPGYLLVYEDTKRAPQKPRLQFDSDTCEWTFSTGIPGRRLTVTIVSNISRSVVQTTGTSLLQLSK